MAESVAILSGVYHLNRAHGRQRLEEIRGIVFVQGVSTVPGATTMTRMPSFAYSMARMRLMASMPVKERSQGPA